MAINVTLEKQRAEFESPIPFKGISSHKQRLFLIALSELGRPVKACAMADVSRQAVFYWRRDDPAFARAYEEAFQMGAESLEEEAHERATRPNFPSDTLLVFLLKGHMPARYGDKSRLELTGANGGAVKIDYSLLSDAELAMMEQLLTKATIKPQVEAPTVDTTSEVVQPPFPILSQENPTSSHPDRATDPAT